MAIAPLPPSDPAPKLPVSEGRVVKKIVLTADGYAQLKKGQSLAKVIDAILMPPPSQSQSENNLKEKNSEPRPTHYFMRLKKGAEKAEPPTDKS